VKERIDLIGLVKQHLSNMDKRIQKEQHTQFYLFQRIFLTRINSFLFSFILIVDF
jgi:hypothetical protein